jgi:alkylation response protein AidB-like acyl-CoA dehydrogenase
MFEIVNGLKAVGFVMPILNRRNLRFVLYELLATTNLCTRDRFSEHSHQTFEAALDVAFTIAEKFFATHNREADANEPHLVNGKVQLIPEVKIALEKFRDAGFFAAHSDFEAGGMQLPSVIALACQCAFLAANPATAAYPFLTIAAGNLLHSFGSQMQKTEFLGKMLEGNWFGTMALSEPQAGSSLADITTRAEPQQDGTYRIFGSKMWISAGEHELSENIVHFVLARVTGAPVGVKGISLFIVPRYRNQNGKLEHNDVNLAGLLHKMGYRGTTSTVLSFGEGGDCHGFLIGEINQGLAYMFQMMNEARIGVGMGATMLALAGYEYSLEYARTRLQGRPARAQRGSEISTAGNKNPLEPQTAIINHSDVRRMLLEQKAIGEGALALGLYASRLVDDEKTHPEESKRKEAALLLELLTPIVKAWSSQFGLKANENAIQILGGYGYTREYPVEQIYRDNRLNPIHEGTTGIQGLDLLGRKIVQFDGASLKLLAREITTTIDTAKLEIRIKNHAEQLEDALNLVLETTEKLLQARVEMGAEVFLANSNTYLEMLGHTVIAWMWLRQAVIAARALEKPLSSHETAFYNGKIQTCTFFYRFELPKIAVWSKLLSSLDTTVLEMQPEWF